MYLELALALIRALVSFSSPRPRPRHLTYDLVTSPTPTPSLPHRAPPHHRYLTQVRPPTGHPPPSPHIPIQPVRSGGDSNGVSHLEIDAKWVQAVRHSRASSSGQIRRVGGGGNGDVALESAAGGAKRQCARWGDACTCLICVRGLADRRHLAPAGPDASVRAFPRHVPSPLFIPAFDATPPIFRHKQRALPRRSIGQIKCRMS